MLIGVIINQESALEKFSHMRALFFYLQFHYDLIFIACLCLNAERNGSDLERAGRQRNTGL